MRASLPRFVRFQRGFRDSQHGAHLPFQLRDLGSRLTVFSYASPGFEGIAVARLTTRLSFRHNILWFAGLLSSRLHASGHPLRGRGTAVLGGVVYQLFDANQRKVLLHLRDGKTSWNPNRWAFFGGNGETGESFRDCFVRELREEIGLEIAPEAAIALRIYRHRSGNERAVFYVRSAVPVSELTLGEGAAMRWIGLDELDAYDLTEATRDDLRFFIAQLPSNRESEK